MKKRGFTEKVYFLNLTLAWIYLFACYMLTVFSGKLEVNDLSVLSSGIPYVFGEVAVFSGFLVWKNKAENCRKYKDVNTLEELEEDV